MYHINYFKAQDHGEVVEFMRQHPFITLCGVDEANQPVATHVPVIIEEREGRLVLLAHIMRKQNHTRAYESNANVLAIFSGAHTYVSASWYDNPRAASTWNYQAVHAKGILRYTDEAALYDVLVRLTEHFENNPHSPALVQQMDEAYVKNMMKAIIAFEIEITAIDHVFKLSQNKDEKTYERITGELEKLDAEAKAVAETMKERKHKLF